jgi:STE24 endopeptidase
LKRRAAVLSLAWSVVLLLALIASGLTISLRSAAETLAQAVVPTRWAAVPTTLLYVFLLMVVNEAGAIPIAFYTGFIVERRYGLSHERLSGWAVDQAKSFGIGLVLAGVGVNVLYTFIRWWPSVWWLLAGTVFALIIVGLANLAPVLLLPLFYTVRPLERESLRLRLLALAERAGARVLGAYEWGLGEKTRKANAALAGLGPTRRILVSDTMLAEYTDDEIEVVLAHEIAHHVHGDIWKGISFESALILAGFYCGARILAAAVAPLDLRGAGDPAGLPLLLLSAGAVSLVTVPAAHAMSRAYERSADRFALELTRNPGAFISAMRRLAAQNLAEDHPSKMVQWLFYSHPPIAERIASAQAFKA